MRDREKNYSFARIFGKFLGKINVTKYEILMRLYQNMSSRACIM